MECPAEMRALLAANTIYALVLPVIEIFVAAYVMRNSQEASKVLFYQLSTYLAIPLTFAINGVLLKWTGPAPLYAAGMIMSGCALLALVTSDVRSWTGILLSGALMGIATGVFWANRGALVLLATSDENRNYYYGVETGVITITSVIVPLALGWLIAMKGRAGGQNSGYHVVALTSLVLTVVASLMLLSSRFRDSPREEFMFFHFHPLWHDMLVLATLRGLVQGYIVTLPALLVLRLVGQEGTLGSIEAAGSAVVAICLYLLGRASRPRHRILVFTSGLVIFFVGSAINAVLFDATGVLVFMGCLLLAKPLMELAYYPIQFLATELVSKSEGRGHYAYIFSHECGSFTGRVLGCTLFLAIAYYVSSTAALLYALPLVAATQLLSIPVARKLLLQMSLLRADQVPTIS